MNKNLHSVAPKAKVPVGVAAPCQGTYLNRQVYCTAESREKKDEIKKFFEAITICAILALAGWLTVSFVDVLMHNDPVYGDKQYMPGQCDRTSGGSGGVGEEKRTW